MVTNSSQTGTKTVKAFGKAVIIGLGGTGQKALLQIKKNFQDTCDGKVPPCVKLLAFDTDQPEAPVRDVHGQEVKFSESEFCRLGVNLVRDAVRSPYVQDWWISFPNLDNIAIADGAGGVREAGRLALFCCVEQVCARITTAYDEMNRFGSRDRMASDGFQLLDGSEQVVVIGSLAGGTGGGLFFDISVLCRKLGGSRFKYMAYVLMPWVYREQANTAYENTFAALVELDRLAGLSVKSPLRISYSKGLEDCTLEESPYHIVNLVDGQCDNGERITRADEIVAFIAESVYHLTGALGAPARSVYDNIIALRMGLSDTDWDGARALYSAIGVSTIRYPAPEMHRSIVCRRTAELLEIVRQGLVTAANEEPEDRQTDRDVNALIEQRKLRPTAEGMVGVFLQAAGIRPVALDDDDFQSLGTREDVAALIAQQTRQVTDKAKQASDRLQAELRESVWKGMHELLEAKPRIERMKAGGDLLATLKEFGDSLTDQCRQADADVAACKSKMARAEDSVSGENTVLNRLTGKFRSQARRYTQAANELLQAEKHATSLRQTMSLFEALVKKLDGFIDKAGGEQSEAESRAAALHAIARGLAAEAETCIPRKGSGKRRFEFVLGVDDRADVENPYYWFLEGSPVPSVEELRALIEGDDQVGPAVARTIPPQDYARRLQDFVAAKCGSVLSPSAVKVLAQNKDKAQKEGREDPTPGLMDNALARSTLLLPLRSELIEQNRKRSIKEFLIVGIGRLATGRDAYARQTEEDQSFIEQALPSYERQNVKVTNTSDPYRITLTRYRAVFPLHAIHGMDELRRAYNERVLPPSHIDCRDLFKLEDPLPEDEARQVALKLLTLSLMECFGVIRHVHKEEGGSYFLPAEPLWPECLDNYDIERKLPGRPGKFYSLIEELSRSHFEGLRRAIREELAGIAAGQGFLPRFFDEAGALQAEFHSLVERMAMGERGSAGRERAAERSAAKVFNKMVTGRYYRREAEFFGRVLRGRQSIEKQVAGGKNLMDVLFDRRERYVI